MAHVIHSQWVLRFIYRHKHLPNLPSRSSTPAPEANSNSLEQIDSTVSFNVRATVYYTGARWCVVKGTDTIPQALQLSCWIKTTTFECM